MGRYDEARAQLEGPIVPLLKAEATGKGYPNTPELDSMLDDRVEKILVNFERVATSHHHRSAFWSGVWQSYFASLLFLLTLALSALLIRGSKQNPFRVLTDEVSPAKAEKTSLTPFTPP